MARTKIDCCTPDCPRRYPGCGTDCPDYKEQRAELDETNKAKRKAANMDRAISKVQYTSLRYIRHQEFRREKQGRRKR